jgi:ABC-type bacteriocin/lantibiotic exporter with double-glycine peptidase domain
MSSQFHYKEKIKEWFNNVMSIENIFFRISISIIIIILAVILFYIFSVALVVVFAISVAIGIVSYIVMKMQGKEFKVSKSDKSNIKHIKITQNTKTKR